MAEDQSAGQGEGSNPTPHGSIGSLFDKRVTPARGDIAAARLKGRVEADRYVDGTNYQVTAAVLPIRRTPQTDGAQETQALFGEVFTVYDEANGWAWGQAAFDDYVGYVDMAGLSAPADVPTHRVTALRSYRFPEPNLKSAPLCLLSMNAKLAIEASSNDERWHREARGGWIFAKHTAPIADQARDPVAVMEAFLGTPYFWGGRESLGLDCSGLIQNGFELAGLPSPRDADMQELFFSAPERGRTVWEKTKSRAPWSDTPLLRGDLIYWPGHTGIMVDPRTMLHANATSMAVTRDDLTCFAGHMERDKDTPITRIVRPRLMS